MNRPSLSATVIVRNEEHDIEACLLSQAGVANEIVVVDSGSTDNTVEIARAYTENIFHHPWNGYAAQKQFALSKTTGEWVINIDADERLSLGLRDEIVATLRRAETGVAGYRIPFHHYFLGRRLRFGGSGNETHIRLFRRTVANYGDDRVHEGINVDGRIARLRGHIDHHSYRDLSEYLEKCNRYTSLIAEKKWAQGARFSPWHNFRLPYEFIVRYFLKGGFLDGQPGLTYAILSAYYVWLKFAKLRDLERQKEVRG
jgi:glycosyltransferase involved in cell wall biosynthesis